MFCQVRVILAFVLGVPNMYLAWAVAKHFGYLQFRIVGASEYLQRELTAFDIYFKIGRSATGII